MNGPDSLIRWRHRSRASDAFRLAVGPVEVAVYSGFVDLLLPPPLGSLVTATWKRDPERMPDIVRRKVAGGVSTSRWIVLNTRPVFLGVLGKNLVEIGVGHWGGVLTWFENDMRRLARRAPGPPPVEDAEPAYAELPPDPYTTEGRLCGDDGMVSREPADVQPTAGPTLTYLDRLNNLRAHTGLAPVDEPFACTGSAHLAGEHIRCTSPAHLPTDDANPSGWPANPDAFIYGPGSTCS